MVSLRFLRSYWNSLKNYKCSSTLKTSWNCDFFGLGVCGIEDLIKPGHIVVADRGFLIEESVGTLGAHLVISVFTRGKY